MNAPLLTAISDAAPVKSGGGGLPFSASGGKAQGAGRSFADLLHQQSEVLDPQLLEMLQALDLDSQAQKELLAQLKELGVDPDQLNQLMRQLSSLTDPKQLQTALNKIQAAQGQIENQNTSDKETNNAASFIRSTLFVAAESKAMRANTGLQPVLTALNSAKETDQNQSNTNRFDLRFDLSKDLNQNSDGKKFTPAFNLNQNSINLNAADGIKFSAAAGTNGPTLLSELSGLSAQGASQPTSNTLAASQFTPSYQAQITTPLSQTAQWGADFSRVMVSLSQQQAGPNGSNGLQTAEIRLDPPELGPLRIVLSVTDSVANAMIFAAHSQTRLTVEQALPQLQQQLAQAGLSLGEANVSDQGFFSQSEQQSEKSNAEFSLNGTDISGDGTDTLTAQTTPNKPMDPNAIIDTFA